MARRKSASEEERMTDINISKVIRMLEDPPEGEKVWTKKDCCQYLGMAYNTTRLTNIIEDWKKQQARNAERRAEKRGKPITQDEAVYIISEYLSGEPIDSISKSTFRNSTLIKNVLDTYSVPTRVTGHTYLKPQLIPDGATRDRFKIGEVVYSTRYDSIARIDDEQLSPKHGYVYRIYLLSEDLQHSAYQEAIELASLEHLRELGVRI